MKTRTTLALLGVGLLLGCSGTEPDLPATLNDLVIEDPTFTFSTSAVAGVEVPPAPAATAPVELRTLEGGLVLQGGFRETTRLDLRLPLSTTRLVRTAGDAEAQLVEVGATR